MAKTVKRKSAKTSAADSIAPATSVQETSEEISLLPSDIIAVNEDPEKLSWSSDEESIEEDDADVPDEAEDEIEEAIAGYLNSDKIPESAPTVSNGDVDAEEDIKPAEESDSSEDERPSRNSIGNVPLKWYTDEKHIGYDIKGEKIIKKEKKDKLDSFLDRMDDKNDWRKVYDEYNDEEIVLTKEEIKMIQRLREGKIPHAEVNPYEPYVDWFEYDGKGHPLSSAPEPKRRFIPSKWEAKAVVKLVRALRKGWIKLEKEPEKPKLYLLWNDDLKTNEKTANGLAYIPAPKPKLPGHEESYNPPVEYVPTEEEVKGYELMYEEDRPKFIPTAYPSLRQVPAYKDFIKERFERCLDLYLCPRTRKKRINIDPESLIPKLPKPKTLKPFPTTMYLQYRGHTAAVSSLSVHPSGQWLASGSHDGTVRIWEVATAYCRSVFRFGSKVKHVAWNPVPGLHVLAVALDKEAILIPTNTGNDDESEAVRQLLSTSSAFPDSDMATWSPHKPTSGITITHQHSVASISWHNKGDYFTTLCPDGISRSVLVHQLSKRATQNPFRRNHGRVQCVEFHPIRPFLFVATKTHIRCYNLAKQQLAKKLTSGVQQISSMAVHSGGDNVIVGSQDMRVVWFDMDLSTKPYKTMRNHKSSVTNVAFHPSYPLFASSADDATCQVFHGMVYSDLMQNPLIVPVKVLRGHGIVNQSGVLDCVFHPLQPWLFTAGADSQIFLYCH